MSIIIGPEEEAVFERLKSNGRITANLRRLITQSWDACSRCHRKIETGHPAFAGYDSSDAPLYVGTCCASQLSELASPIYWTGTLNLTSAETRVVWRYMDFAKFVAMLQQGGLYLSRADKFEDPFEGASGVKEREPIWDEHYLEHFRELVVSVPDGYPTPSLSKEEIESEANRLLKDMKRIASLPRTSLVSCWHGGKSESEALWRLYSPPNTHGVAIRSTVGKLWDACSADEKAVVGPVHYIDFKQSFTSIQNERIFQKRASLRHEEEIRIVFPNDPQGTQDGRVLVCDLNALITEVVASPFSPSWLMTTVADVVEKYCYSFDIRTSELLDQPFF